MQRIGQYQGGVACAKMDGLLVKLEGSQFPVAIKIEQSLAKAAKDREANAGGS